MRSLPTLFIPPLGAIVEDKRHDNDPYRNVWVRRYRVDSYLCKAPPPRFADWIDGILYQGCRGFGEDSERLMWCPRELATHLSCSGVAGAIIPVRYARMLGMVEWSPEMHRQHYEGDFRSWGERLF